MRISDWSSDVCSSDLVELMGDAQAFTAEPQPRLCRFIIVVARDVRAGHERIAGGRVEKLEALIDTALGRVACARRRIEHKILGHVIFEFEDTEDVAAGLIIPWLAIVWVRGGTEENRVRKKGVSK